MAGRRPDTLYPKISLSVRISWLLVLVMISGLYPVQTDIFSSIHSLDNLFRNEEWLVEQINHQLDIYLDTTKRNVLERKMQDVRASRKAKSSMTESEWDDYVTDYIGHPVNAYHLIKLWYQVMPLMEDISPKFYQAIVEVAHERALALPEEADYHGALRALVRLQKAYSLPSRELAAGRVYNVSAMYHLDQADCMEMGRRMMNIDHAIAYDWFDMLISMGVDDHALESEIYRHLINVYKQSRNWKRALHYAQRAKMLELDIDMEEFHLIQDKIFEEITAGTHTDSHYSYWSVPREYSETYEQLCRGEGMTNSIFVNKNLICVYRKGPLPYVQYKEEIHSFDPRISLLIDVITDEQANMLKSKASPQLNRASVFVDSDSTEVSEMRTAKLHWLWDHEDTEVTHLSKKVSQITGLETEYKETHSGSEPFQVVNYGMGGQYEPHYDYSTQGTDYLEGSGDRMSTFMFYLSDVKAGGATVFPNIGVRVPPIMYAAAFWHNFQLHGQAGDPRTRHAGCPVLLGQKWVGNKWIHQTSQMFLRSCGLHENQSDPIWYS